MKSIVDTLNLLNQLIDDLRPFDSVKMALIGGYAGIAYGVSRTTLDVDFCVVSPLIEKGEVVRFFGFLREVLPAHFDAKMIRASRSLDDPFKHDVIFINDKELEFPRIDLMLAQYQWELEGLMKAKPLADFPFPIIPKPYLIAMKLKAGGPKDQFDVIEIFRFSTKDEQDDAMKLAEFIHKDKLLKKWVK